MASSGLTLLERYRASMVLSGVGDAIGYKNGEWEFCHSGEAIHAEVKKIGGIEKLKVKLPNWSVSDDTVMHLATAEALVQSSSDVRDTEHLYQTLAARYKECMHDMTGRAPGIKTKETVSKLKPLAPQGYQQPFDAKGGGCGAAMRAMCIGLRFARPEELPYLISTSIEAGRMTHHHPTGYLGSLAAALFVSYSIQGKPVKEWGKCLMSVLPEALEYIEQKKRFAKENKEAWGYFTDKWTAYLKLRGIEDGTSEPIFPDDYSVKARDKFYKSLSFSGWGGASGHDAPMIAYDALLGAGDNWAELCSKGMWHSGDSDSTGVIAAACFGAMYGFNGVPKANYEKLEYRKRLEDMAEKLFELSKGSANQSQQQPDLGQADAAVGHVDTKGSAAS